MTYPYVISKHTATIITLIEVKQWLRMDIVGYDAENDLIAALIAGAVGYIEEACNIQLGVSTFRWETPWQPCEIRDTFYVQALTSINHRVDGADELIADTNYSLWRTGPRGSAIEWKDNYTSSSDRFIIEFTAGFPEGEVPPRLKMAIRALVVHWYDNREDFVSEKKTFSDKLIAPFVNAYVG